MGNYVLIDMNGYVLGGGDLYPDLYKGFEKAALVGKPPLIKGLTVNGAEYLPFMSTVIPVSTGYDFTVGSKTYTVTITGNITEKV